MKNKDGHIRAWSAGLMFAGLWQPAAEADLRHACFVCNACSGLLCDAYNTTEQGEKDCTRIYIMEKSRFGKRLLERENQLKNISDFWAFLTCFSALLASWWVKSAWKPWFYKDFAQKVFAKFLWVDMEPLADVICQPCSHQCPRDGLGWLPVRLSHRPLHVNPTEIYPPSCQKPRKIFGFPKTILDNEGNGTIGTQYSTVSGPLRWYLDGVMIVGVEGTCIGK